MGNASIGRYIASLIWLIWGVNSLAQWVTAWIIMQGSKVPFPLGVVTICDDNCAPLYIYNVKHADM